jgi:hypothetical protein
VRPVAPQITVPFGKTPPPPPKREERAARAAAAASEGVDDAAARCESQTDARARANCRAQLVRPAPGKASN